MKEIVLSLRFRHHSSCSCGGTYAEKYTRRTPEGIFQIEIKPARNVWSLRLDGTFKVKGTKENLTEKLTEYGIV